jgi:signal transduction histidine kinase
MMLPKFSYIRRLTLSMKLTITVSLYLAAALCVLTGMIIHLQKENFAIKAREAAYDINSTLSRALFHRWNPDATKQENAAQISAIGDLDMMVNGNDYIAYVVFQDTDGKILYVLKSLPEYVWMMQHTQMDAYSQRVLGISGSASRMLGSYPEGAVTEYISTVYGKEKKVLGLTRVGVSEKKISSAMVQLSKTTILKIVSVNLLALALMMGAVFYLTSTIESRLRDIHQQASHMLEIEGSKEDANVLVQLTQEFTEIENLVKSLRHKFIELASTISHEFRSPLQAIEGYVDFLRKGCAGPVTPQQDKYLKIIGENAERFQGFIDNVMDLVRLGGGGLKLHSAEFKAADVTARACELFLKQASENNIRLMSHADAGLQAYGDSNRVYQVLVNLISNALKFTPPFGRIDIGARHKGGSVEFFVSDTGPGIPEEKQSKLFSEFYQVPGIEPLRGYKGLGIGLALCKKLIEAQNGAIHLESAPGKGTAVAFTLPAVQGVK